jgi:hypothetical protein
MDTIARIPDLGRADPTEPTGGVEQAPLCRAALCRAGITPGSGRRRPQFPAGSIAGLMALAAVAWALATWHEQDRLARQRRPDRLAAQPPATARESIAP